MFFELRIFLFLATNLHFEKIRTGPLNTFGILREKLFRFGIKNRKHFSTYPIACTHVTKVMFTRRFDPTRGIPKTIYRPIPKVELCLYSYIPIIKRTRCTNFSNLFFEYNSTRFGQVFCPSSVVKYCTHSNRYMSYRLCLLLASG
jgi:hypothetical protein